MLRSAFLLATCLFAANAFAQNPSAKSDPLPGTAKLEMEGDISFAMIDGVDRFLLKQWEAAAEKRHKEWEALTSQPDGEAKTAAFQEKRQQLLKILGAQEERVPITDVTQVDFHFLAKCNECDVYAVSWPVVRSVRGEGLLLVPNHEHPDWPKNQHPITEAQAFREALAAGRFPKMEHVTIAIPDADQTPEMVIGLQAGTPVQSQFPRLRVSDGGGYVLIPALIDRTMGKRNGRSVLSTREFLYRPGFELGHHLLGYELQRIRAALDWMQGPASKDPKTFRAEVIGYGEGGLLALLTGATDERVKFSAVSGYFGSHPKQWDEPIDRNLFGGWNHFGNAELVALAVGSPRRGDVFIEPAPGPEVDLPGNGGGAPSKLVSPTKEEVDAELQQLKKYKLPEGSWKSMAPEGDTVFGTRLKKGKPEPKFEPNDEKTTEARIAARKKRLESQIEEDTQKLLVESPYVRAEFMKKLDTSSVENYQKSVEEYRTYFADKVIGRFDLPLLESKARTRQVYDEKLWTGYEVVLDVFPDVIAYGLLLVPKNILAGEKRPVVVCQHGLEGRPQSTIGDFQKEYYSAFAAKLAERGYVTFAPQNLYLGKDRFRTLQRKANPLGKTLFSIIVPQHQQIVNWLSTQPFVDKDRIAFYGLSYGGKSAMRIPPLVPQYCAVICSADFNEWVWKNASTRAPYSYVWTNEYEIFEWDLGSTFNYAEMAALICPRPFMVERGHFDGVSSDEAVAYEFAKVNFLYSARLKIPDKTEMEIFDGPHKINGVGTFKFLDKHLKHTPRQ